MPFTELHRDAEKQSSVLFLHAHPDDESIDAAGTMSLLADRGVAVFLLTGTRGERGEVMPGRWKKYENTEQLAEIRAAELAAAAAEIGVSGHLFLGEFGARANGKTPRTYRDSGMAWQLNGKAGPAHDASTDSLSLAPVEEVVADVLSVIKRIHPRLIVADNEEGGYGHPDHIRMHEAAVAAARAANVPLYLIEPDEKRLAQNTETVTVPLGKYVEHKKRALAAHRTQLTVKEHGFVLSGGQHRELTGVEYFRKFS